MGPSLKWLILVIGLFINVISVAQKIFFEQLTTAEGLPSDYVNSVFRDSKGFLWIATDKGACRYDGMNFIYLNKDNGLTSNFVNCFAEDPDGNIWIGMIEGGVCKYDGEKIISFTTGIEDIFKNTRQIHFNDDKSFFLVTFNSLYYCHSENSTPQKIEDCSGFLAPLSLNNFIVGKGSNTLYKMEKKDHALSIHELQGPVFFKISSDEFILRNANELLVYKLEDRSFLFKRKFILRQNTLSANAVEVKDVLLAGNGLFIATTSGLIYADEQNNELFLNSSNGIGADFIQDIYEDSEGNIFLCTFGGGVKVWPRLYLQEFKMEGKVTSILPGGNGTFITTTSSFYKFKPLLNQLSGFLNFYGGNYTTSYRSAKGELYIGTLNSFYHFPEENSIGNFSSAKRSTYAVPMGSGVSGFYFNSNSKLYVGSYGEGISVFENKNKEPGNFNNRKPAIVEFIASLKNSFAALTYSSGLTLFYPDKEPVEITTKQGLLSNTVYSAYQEKANEIWIGTFKGLNLFDGKKITKTFTYDKGFIGTKVICIFSDAQKRFWVLSDKYLHLLENDRLRAIRSHPVQYDPKNSINRAAYDPYHDRLYVGLNNSFLTLDLKKIVPDTSIQQPILTTIQIDTSLANHTENKIIVPATFRKISFGFGSHYTPLAKKSDFYYQLKGIDDDWQLLDASAEVVYQKLPAGNYELIAKTINPDGHASEETSLLQLEILPPFWKRTWFMILVLLVLLTIFFFTGKTISKRKYRQKIQQLQQEHHLQLERERIAMELHDNVGSQLTYLINKIDDDYPLLANREEAGKLSLFARGAMQELRETIWALDKKEITFSDFYYKVKQLASLLNNGKDIIHLEYNSNGPEKILLNSFQAISLYRIIQESVNNSLKHSKANNIDIFLNQDKGVLNVTIQDDGIGFDTSENTEGYGLRNMRSRASEMQADLTIESEKEKGTSVSVRLSVY